MRQKVTLRLNPEVIDLVRQVAQDEGISPASMVDRLLLEGLQRYAQDALDLDGFLQPQQPPSDSMVPLGPKSFLDLGKKRKLGR